jgi:hypothetical protein
MRRLSPASWSEVQKRVAQIVAKFRVFRPVNQPTRSDDQRQLAEGVIHLAGGA